MSGTGYSDKIKHLDREYLVQTSINGQTRSINVSIFHSGQLISGRVFPHPDNLDDQGLAEYTLEIHRQYRADFASLLGLIEKMKESDRPDIIGKIGMTLYSRKLYNEGLELLASAVEKHPENSGLKMIMGKLLLATGRFAEAQASLKSAVDLSPEYPDYRNLLGVACLRSEKPVEAIAQFKKAVELNIYFDQAHFNLGLGYILNGIVKEDFELARNLKANSIEAFGKAAMFNPRLICDEYKKGLALLEEDKLEESFAILADIAENPDIESPKERLMEMYLRYVHGENGVTEDGIKDYIEKIQNLLKASPAYADLQNELGMAYTIMGKFMRDKAIEHFKKALDVNPRFSRANKNLRLSENDLKGFEVLLEAILK